MHIGSNLLNIKLRVNPKSSFSEYLISQSNLDLLLPISLYNFISLKTIPDAIFTITDDAAIGAIKTLNKHKIKIPQEIAVTGFSNSPNSTIIEPKLTTIDQPGGLIGSTAIKYLIEEIENDSETTINKTVEIKTNLRIRDSTFRS